VNVTVITGGAGFVGSSLGILRKRDFPGERVVAFDNLSRAGSELNLPRLAAAGVEFMRGDVRHPADLEALGEANLLIDCAAEPSVRAGYGNGEKNGGARELVAINLGGTLNCLEFARARAARLVFLSTSRVYPIAPLRALPLDEGATRLAIAPGKSGPGWSARGIAADFPLAGSRSLYGATKLSSELFVEEYAAAYGVEAVLNRCGVLAGPWQMGKVDQGFFALWAARHLYGGNLSYQGFGGKGLQVRDVLHPEDLHELLKIQLSDLSRHAGAVYNVGGGANNAVSLRELSDLCAAESGNRLDVGGIPETHPADIPWYVTDNTEVTRATGWTPKRSVADILGEVFSWLRAERATLEPLLKS
jgi:CDP-paratose 2-epimerase